MALSAMTALIAHRARDARMARVAAEFPTIRTVLFNILNHPLMRVMKPSACRDYQQQTLLHQWVVNLFPFRIAPRDRARAIMCARRMFKTRRFSAIAHKIAQVDFAAEELVSR
jgi:hypothetical protein